FTGGHLQMLMDKQHITPAPPRAHLPGVPRDLDELCVQLLQFRARERPRGDEVLRRLGVVEPRAQAPKTEPSDSDSAPFVGRRAEFAALDAAFAALQAGRTLTLSVEGPSGIGKSALVSRFLRRVSADGELMVLQGRCYERETARFKALDGLIDALATSMTRL